MNIRFSISSERRQAVLEEISEGSSPEFRFYIMVVISTLIACFGLITNSTAVIIGAMLVAPLMTPIFGLALALIRSDTSLFRKALKAEIVGVAAAIAMSFMLGIFYPALEPTPEMIARTEPQLFDLLVAVFSGLAGAYALLDEKISPALPGVAIATAIVPPLANAGLCFSVGQYLAGIGSFLLFFANFLSILLVASAAFWLFGMAKRFSDMDGKTIIKRFRLPIVCFVLVAAFLTNTLINIAADRYLNDAITTVMEKELLKFPDTTLGSIKFDEQKKTIYVYTDLYSSRVMTPTQVTRLQDSLHKEIGKPVELIVHNKIGRQITALGSDLHLTTQQLDGSFISPKAHPRVRTVKIVDTLIRNELSKSLGYELDSVRVYYIEGIPHFVASIYGVSPPLPDLIDQMEIRIRKALDDLKAKLLISFIHAKLYGSSGSVKLEFLGLGPQNADREEIADTIANEIAEDLNNKRELIITGMNHQFMNETLHVFIEAYGPAGFTTQEIADIEKRTASSQGVQTRLFVVVNTDAVVTSQGYKYYPEVSRIMSQQQQEQHQSSIQKIIEASNR